jgi:mannose-1-phosphate guanylyltransferase
MRALLLAAGLGIRLRPLTNYLPKCLVPIHGRPLLDYWLETLVNAGVSEILINTHYFEPLVRQYLSQSTWLPYIKVVHEEILLGTGGTILRNRDFFNDEAFLVAHADNLTIFDVRDFANQHAVRPKETELTMMVFETPDPQSCGIVIPDRKNIVQAFHEKVASPPGTLANAAVYMLEPSVVDMMATLGKEQIDLSTGVIPHLLGKMLTYRNTCYHRDIGTIASWTEANKDFPVMPSTAQDAKAWDYILESGDGSLPSIIEQLLVSTAQQRL